MKIKTFHKCGRTDHGWTPKAVLAQRIKILNNKEAQIPPRRLKSQEVVKAMTLGDAFELWEKHLKANYRDKVKPIQIYHRYLKRWAKLPIGEITSLDLSNAKDEWADPEGKWKLGPSTILGNLLTLSRIYTYMKNFHGYVGPRPFVNGILPKVNRRRLRYLTFEECDQLLSALRRENLRIYYQAAIARYAGLRRSEVLKLRRRKLLKLVQKYGVSLNEQIDDRLIIDAPRGKKWHGIWYHCIGECLRWDDSGPDDKMAAYADAIRVMEDGLEDCTEPGCAICNQEDMSTL